MNVTLRQRTKGKKVSLYLDYYDNGTRVYEFLKLYLTPAPEKGKLTPQQIEDNRKNLALAESIRAKRHLEIQSNIYGFYDKEKLKSSYIKYFESLINIRDNNRGNHGNWKSVLIHIKNYSGNEVNFAKVNQQWLEGFKNYLNTDAKSKTGKLLSPNTKFSYYSKVVASLKQAVKDGILKINPADQVDNPKQSETQREFLTLDELHAIYKTKCDNELLKRAFMFSALTGLRWSDIVKLKWKEVQYSNENGYYLRYQQEKTKAIETLFISEDAHSFLGEKEEGQEVVFEGLKYSAWNNLKLREWMMRAGISKSITFHCARHTYATLLITQGTDIFTVSKLLGHKNLKNTQIYAKIIDDKKKEAANKITLGITFKK